MLVEQAEVHQQMRPQFAGTKGIEWQLEADALLDETHQRAHQRRLGIVALVAEGFGTGIDRLEAMPVFLRQRLEQCDDLFLEQSRHQPIAALRRHLV
jgi:hypothetical protein